MREIFEENMYRQFYRAIVALRLRIPWKENLLDENNNKDNIIKNRVQEKISELSEQRGVTCYIFGHTALTFLPKNLIHLYNVTFWDKSSGDKHTIHEITCSKFYVLLTVHPEEIVDF
jgi:hypothetical protein